MRVAFLANSFHLSRTKSSDFFIELLRETFEEVRVIPLKDAWAEIPGTSWDALIVWQGMLRPEELDAFGIRNIVLIPMYDASPHDRESWQPYSRFKVFCFSTTLYADLKSWGFEVFGAQYFPPVPTGRQTPAVGSLAGFFWPRTNDVTWETVKKVIGSARFEKIRFHWTAQVHTRLSYFPSDEDLRNYKMVVSSWIEDKAEYERTVQSSTVFFASRRQEGIGMSFLEAMGWGLCVVAADQPTMNEYIQHGRTGILYDPSNPGPVDFTKWRQIGHAAAEHCRVGRAKWNEALPSIKEFLAKPIDGYTPGYHPILRINRRTEAFLRGAYRAFKRLRRGE